MNAFTDAIKRALSTHDPVTVRRVLPRDFIEKYIHDYVSDMSVMMKSFQAILTFPTTGRDLPKKVMRQMYHRLGQDLKHSAQKIEGEVDFLLKEVRRGKSMQSHIMLNVLAETPFPFCLLNTVEHKIGARDFIPAYVVLWARYRSGQNAVEIWLQLAPRLAEHAAKYDFQSLRSEPQWVRLPAGEVYFSAFQTMASAIIYDVPTAAEATFSGKSLPELLHELKDIRNKLVRNKEQRGKFLHILWKKHEKDDYLPVEEFRIAQGRKYEAADDPFADLE
jgi:hypothetical protein